MTVPMKFLCFRRSLFKRLWFHMWRWCCPHLFLIPLSFGALGGLCFVIVIFPGYFHLHFVISFYLLYYCFLWFGIMWSVVCACACACVCVCVCVCVLASDRQWTLSILNYNVCYYMCFAVLFYWWKRTQGRPNICLLFETASELRAPVGFV